MEGNSGTACLKGIVENVFTKLLPHNLKENIFCCREKILADATSGKIIMIIGYLFLIDDVGESFRGRRPVEGIEGGLEERPLLAADLSGEDGRAVRTGEDELLGPLVRSIAPRYDGVAPIVVEDDGQADIL